MMNNETYLDFCFIREMAGGFAGEIDSILQDLFKGKRLNWYLEEKTANGAEIVVAEVKGMSNWHSEDETIDYLEVNAGESFWEYLQGYKMYIYPAKGCGTSAKH